MNKSELVFNRTQKDVDEARHIRRDYIQKGLAINEEQREKLERGTITVNTLNRIETAQEELSNMLNSMGYYGCNAQNQKWDEYDIFQKKDFSRILKNLEMLKNSFFWFWHTPDVPELKYYYRNVNDIEKIMYDLFDMADQLKQRYRICGTFSCGEELS